MDFRYDTYDPPRLKRQYRIADPRPLAISETDLEIFDWLLRFRYLRTRQIWALLRTRGKSYDAFRRRLKKLFRHAYLDRPAPQRLQPNFYYADIIYELDVRGRREAGRRGVEPPFYDLLARGQAGATKQFPHAMMIVDCLVSIELGAREAGLHLVPWGELISRVRPERMQNPYRFPEVAIRHTFNQRPHTATVSLIPDAVFAIRYPTGYVFYVLECEHGNPVMRTTFDQNSAFRKVLAYRELRRHRLFEKHIGSNRVVVLFAMPSAARVQTALEMMQIATQGNGSTMFGFHAVPVFGETIEANPPFPKLLAEPWARADHPPFCMSNP
jgi:hypothetical protein